MQAEATRFDLPGRVLVSGRAGEPFRVPYLMTIERAGSDRKLVFDPPVEVTAGEIVALVGDELVVTATDGTETRHTGTWDA